MTLSIQAITSSLDEETLKVRDEANIGDLLQEARSTFASPSSDLDVYLNGVLLDPTALDKVLVRDLLTDLEQAGIKPLVSVFLRTAGGCFGFGVRGSREEIREERRRYYVVTLDEDGRTHRTQSNPIWLGIGTIVHFDHEVFGIYEAGSSSFENVDVWIFSMKGRLGESREWEVTITKRGNDSRPEILLRKSNENSSDDEDDEIISLGPLREKIAMRREDLWPREDGNDSRVKIRTFLSRAQCVAAAERFVGQVARDIREETSAIFNAS